MSDEQYLLIIGCGRLGSLLANKASANGYRVVVIDNNPAAFESLSVEFSGYHILGDASEQSVLNEAGIDQADYFFSVTSRDNLNLMVAQIAKKVHNVQHVIARVDDPHREKLYREFGIETISPTQLSADAFLKSLDKAFNESSE